MKAVLLAVAALLFAGRAAGDERTAIDIDASRAEIAWRAAEVIDVPVDRDTAFVETKDNLRRIKGSSGDTIWTYEFGEAFRAPEFVVLLDRVAIVRNDRYVTFLSSRTGEKIGRADAGEWIRYLAGPPLLVVTQASDAAVSTLVRMSSDGTILGTRTVPRVSDVRIVADVAIVQLERGYADPKLETVTGYDLATLEPLWSEKSFTFNKQVIGDHVYLGDIFWSSGARAIDPRSGAIEALVPVRDPFQIGGSAEFDLQVVSSKWSGAWNPDHATCQGLRRNDARTGKTMWRIDLPFRVSATLRDGGRLFVTGSRDSDQRYLLVLDWKTGKVEHAWSGVPKMSRLRKLDDLILGFDLENELVAIRVSGH